MNRMKNRKRFQLDQCPTNFILQSETNSDFQAIRGTYFSSYLSVTVCQCQRQLWQKTFPLWNHSTGMSSTVLHANQIDFLMHLILTILQLYKYNGVSDVGDCDYGSKYWAWSRDSFGASKAWSHPCSSL